MFDTLKKTIYAGFGAASLSKDAIETVLSEWVKKGKISAEDAKEFFVRASKIGEESWEKTCDGISEKAEGLGKKWPFSTREQVCKINKRLKAIEEKLGIPTECDCCCDREKSADASVPASDAEVVD